MTIHAITFDLDDTLWPIAPVIEQANKTLMPWLTAHAPRFIDRYGDNAFEELKQLVLAEQPELINNMTKLRMTMLETGLLQVGHANAKTLAQAAFAVYYQMRNQVTFYADAMAQLTQLSNTYRMGAITNGNADIQAVGLGHLFEFSYSAEAMGVAKPEPALFQHAIDHLQHSPEQIIHVGDHPIADIAGAQQVGMHTIWVNTEQQPWPTEQPPATAEITHLSQLCTAVAKIKSNLASGL